MSRRKRLVGNPLRGSRKILLDERVRTSQTFDKDIHCCHHCGGDTLESRSVLISGVWLRFIEGKVQVLAEVEGKWRMLMEESLEGNPTFSHIYEPLGVRSAPVDLLMEMTYRGRAK